MNTTSAYVMAVVGLVLSILIIITLSTDHWEDYETITENASSTDPISVGLWRFCRRNGCVHFSEFMTSFAMKAARAFIFMSMLMGLAGTLFSLRKACGKPDSPHFINVFFMSIVLFMFIGMIIYTALDIENEFFTAEVTEAIAKEAARFWGYSFIIGWITFILSIFAFILSFWLNRSPKSVDH